jgi:hypothetical protein
MLHVLTSAAAVVVATLTGGLRDPLPPANHTASVEGACPDPRAWADSCAAADASIHPLHILVPWAVTLGTVVALGLPCVLTPYKGREYDLRAFAGHLLQILGLLACTLSLGHRPAICFALTLHGTLRLLLPWDQPSAWHRVAWPPASVWPPTTAALMRPSVAAGLLALQLCEGPSSLSVVRWPSSAGEEGPLSCAYQAHLVGALGPDLMLLALRFLVISARYIQDA